MNSSENPNDTSEVKNDIQHSFASYQHEFKATLDQSAEALHRTISEAQRSIAGQINAATSEPFQSQVMGDAGAIFNPITQEVVERAFAKAREIFDQIEQTAAELQAELPAAPASLPQLIQPAQAIPQDLMAATDQLMAQSVESLKAAMESVLQPLTRPPSESGMG